MGIDARILIRGVDRAIVTPEWLRAKSVELCTSLDSENFIIDRTRGAHAIVAIDNEYEQDGDSICPLSGERLLEVMVATRYYGINYERGDLLLLCGIAEWIEQNIPCAEVWYGGDSSGVCARPWPAEDRSSLRRHLYSQRGRDYRFDDVDAKRGVPYRRNYETRYCAFCQIPMTRHGWGVDYASFNCRGCGARIETRDGGVSWQEPEHHKWGK